MMRLALATIARRFQFRRPERQRLMPFLLRMRRTDRIFRGLIVGVTVLALGGIWAAWPSGRGAASSLVKRARWAAERLIGLEPERSDVDAYWRDRRERRAVSTRERYQAKFAEQSPEQLAFLRTAGMSPEDAVIRWGNYDMTLVMSGQVFERVDSGRLYRLRPWCARSGFGRSGSSTWMSVCFSFRIRLTFGGLPGRPVPR